MEACSARTLRERLQGLCKPASVNESIAADGPARSRGQRLLASASKFTHGRNHGRPGLNNPKPTNQGKPSGDLAREDYRLKLEAAVERWKTYTFRRGRLWAPAGTTSLRTLQ